jgi:hypothetical protein
MTRLRVYADETAADESYRLLSIDAVRAPQGCTGNDWHIYRISQGENGITGYRRGNLTQVKAEVETILTALNERRQWSKRKAAPRSGHRAAAAPKHEAGK